MIFSIHTYYWARKIYHHHHHHHRLGQSLPLMMVHFQILFQNVCWQLGAKVNIWREAISVTNRLKYNLLCIWSPFLVQTTCGVGLPLTFPSKWAFPPWAKRAFRKICSKTGGEAPVSRAMMRDWYWRIRNNQWRVSKSSIANWLDGWKDGLHWTKHAHTTKVVSDSSRWTWSSVWVGLSFKFHYLKEILEPTWIMVKSSLSLLQSTGMLKKFSLGSPSASASPSASSQSSFSSTSSLTSSAPLTNESKVQQCSCLYATVHPSPSRRGRDTKKGGPGGGDGGGGGPCLGPCLFLAQKSVIGHISNSQWPRRLHDGEYALGPRVNLAFWSLPPRALLFAVRCVPFPWLFELSWSSSLFQRSLRSHLTFSARRQARELLNERRDGRTDFVVRKLGKGGPNGVVSVSYINMWVIQGRMGLEPRFSIHACTRVAFTGCEKEGATAKQIPAFE